MNEALAAVADLVRRETGITISHARQAALRGAIERAAPGLGAEGFARVAKEPARHRDLVDRLIDEVTVQETAFLRDGDQLDLIAWHSLASSAQPASALPSRSGTVPSRSGTVPSRSGTVPSRSGTVQSRPGTVQSRSGPVRVWSAACASGEEAYTLALLATEAFAPAPAPVEILGTDISRAALAAAEAGRYRERSIRALGPQLRQRYFHRQPDGSYLVTGELRRLVRFRRHNLVRDPVPPLGEDSFDVVVCRNVLIYFTAAVAGSVAGKLERSLSPNGIIVLGAADALTRAGGTPRPAPEQPAAMGIGAGRVAPAGPVTGAGRPKDTAQPTAQPPSQPAASAPSRAERLTAAVRAADLGDRKAALDQVMTLISQDPLDAEAQFIHGLVALEAGEPAVAAAALRRALYADSRFAVAAFALGRAYDALSDFAAARRAYEQALRTLDPDDDRHELLLQQIQINDIAAACRVRLGGAV